MEGRKEPSEPKQFWHAIRARSKDTELRAFVSHDHYRIRSGQSRSILSSLYPMEIRQYGTEGGSDIAACFIRVHCSSYPLANPDIVTVSLHVYMASCSLGHS